MTAASLGLWLLTGACAHAAAPTIELSFGTATATVEIADEPALRSLGLMHREALERDHGMVFVYPDERPRSFWMKNTLVPLSIAYLDSQGRVVHIADMTPLSETPVPSLRPAMYAVEMEKGWFQSHGVGVGQKVEGLPQPSQQ